VKILFCNIAWMDYYKGIVKGIDEPRNGGSYVTENGDAHEAYNFASVFLGENVGYPDGEYCLGFVETKSTNINTRNQLNIEKIDGCELCKKENEVEDVLVIYCAKYPDSMVQETYVVGWYRHATVYRYYETLEFSDGNDGVFYQDYNAIARKENCVLLPRSVRRKSNIWRVPRKSSGVSYGFGQANVWFASGRSENNNLDAFLDRIVKQIEEYEGDNWRDVDAAGMD
jgi:hypothetical protein